MVVAVCDDDIQDIEYLRTELKEFYGQRGEACQVHTYSEPKAFLEEIKNTVYDAAFLDIDMPEISGLEVAEKLCKYSPDTAVIFVSSCEDMVFQAIKVSPLRFVRKSKLDTELSEACMALLEKFHNKRNYHDFCVNGNLVRIKLTDISYFESVKHYVAVRTRENESFHVRGKMSDMEQIFGDKGFVRVQAGYIVNLRYVDRVRYKDLLMTSGECITVSRDRLEEVKRKHLEFIRHENNL